MTDFDHSIANSDETQSNDYRQMKERDIFYFNDISGLNAAGHTKAIINLRWYEKNSDGTETDIREITVQKPVVYIMKRPGYINLFLNFMRRIDVDLQNCWDLITDYFNPTNSVSYTEEEYESGLVSGNDGTEDRLVYFPLLEVRLSPIGKEMEYIVIGVNPASVSLAAPSPAGEPCVLQMVFEEDFFIVETELDQLDIEQMQREIIAELQEGSALDLMR